MSSISKCTLLVFTGAESNLSGAFLFGRKGTLLLSADKITGRGLQRVAAQYKLAKTATKHYLLWLVFEPVPLERTGSFQYSGREPL